MTVENNLARQALITRAEALILRLRRGLNAEDVASGWSDASRTAILKVCERFLAELQAGRAVTGLPWSDAARGLDAWGVFEGSLF